MEARIEGAAEQRVQQVEDNLLLGLTARQLVRVAVGASLAYNRFRSSMQQHDIGMVPPKGFRKPRHGPTSLSSIPR